MVSRYKKHDRWKADDANWVMDSVEQLIGFYDLQGGTGSTKIAFGKASGDIVPDTNTGQVELYDEKEFPPTPTGEFQEDVWYTWLSDEKISDGKEVELVKIGNNWHVLSAECEDDTDEVQQGDGDTPTPPTP